MTGPFSGPSTSCLSQSANRPKSSSFHLLGSRNSLPCGRSTPSSTNRPGNSPLSCCVASSCRPVSHCGPTHLHRYSTGQCRPAVPVDQATATGPKNYTGKSITGVLHRNSLSYTNTCGNHSKIPKLRKQEEALSLTVVVA